MEGRENLPIEETSSETPKPLTSFTRVAESLGFRKLKPNETFGDNIEFVRPTEQKNFPLARETLTYEVLPDGGRLYRYGVNLIPGGKWLGEWTLEDFEKREEGVVMKDEFKKKRLTTDDFQRLQARIIERKEEGRFDSSMKTTIERYNAAREYTLQMAETIRDIYPEYSETLDTFPTEERICIYKPGANRRGHMAINIKADDNFNKVSFGYTLGYVREASGVLFYRYKSLPAIVKTQTRKGIQMDYPQTDWKLDPLEDGAKRQRSLDELFSTLELLREHKVF